MSDQGRRGDLDAALPTDPDSASERSGLPLHLRASALAMVFVGGAVGTSARYGLALASPTEAGRWPWGSFIANMIGCLVLGALLETLSRLRSDAAWHQRLRLLGGTGFCGGLTTYSTFAVEGELLLRDHHVATALGYLAATLVVGFAATVLGIMGAGRVDSRRSAT